MDPILYQLINAPVFDIPDPADGFGQDGGKFYRAYDVVAGEIDDDMTKSLKEQLDGMLIFAGLFAGVNSAFLALTIPLLSADPSDDISALLAQNNAILMQLATGRNDTPSSSALPSAAFAPAHDIVAINALFGLSLAFAIISSFLAVLGRQWLVYYRKRGGGGPDRQRWEQLKRFLGAERWRMELILDDILPSLLQVALIIFCISLIIYLRHLSPVISLIVGVPMYTGLAVFIGSAMCTLWDRFCPYHSPLSHLLGWTVQNMPLLYEFIISRFRLVLKLARGLLERRGYLLSRSNPLDDPPSSYRTADELASSIRDPVSVIPLQLWLQRLFKRREEESPESLQLIALRRVICTSDDPATLHYAIANIPSIANATETEQLWNDSVLQERFISQFQTSYDRMLQLRGHDQTDIASASWRLYCASAVHIMLSSDVGWDDCRRILQETCDIPDAAISWRSDYPKTVVTNTLAFVILQGFFYYSSSLTFEELCDSITAYSATLVQGEWRLLCIIAWAIKFCAEEPEEPSIESLRKAYRGDREHASATLAEAIEVLVGPTTYWRSALDCDRILTNMLECLHQVVAVDQSRSSIAVEHKFAYLELCEPVLRGPRVPGAARQAIRELRVDLIRVWNGQYMDWVTRFWNTEILLDTLEGHLSKLVTLCQTDPLYHEYIEALRAFGPPIHKLFAPDTVDKWPNVSHKRYPFLRTFNELVSMVERMSRRLQKKARRVQDPDERWCHWEEESWSVEGTYSLS